MPLTDGLTGLAIDLSLTGSLSVCFAGDPLGSYADYEDLSGPDIGAILGQVGWRYCGAGTRVDAFDSAGAVPEATTLPAASAWATPIVTSAGVRGINISYGVGAAYRGQGLAALLAYVAVCECRALQTLRLRPAPTIVNVQARASNVRSQGVARALGIEQDTDAAFAARLFNRRTQNFVGFREDIDAFVCRGLSPTVSRLENYAPGLLAAEATAAANRSADGPSRLRPSRRARRPDVANSFDHQPPDSWTLRSSPR